MARKDFFIIIHDDDGDPHEYSTVQFGALFGFDLKTKLATTCGRGVGQALGAVDWSALNLGGLVTPEEVDAPDEEEGDDNLELELPPLEGDDEEIVAQATNAGFDLSGLTVDGDALGAGVHSIVSGIAKQGGSKLLLQIFRHTVRDGKKIDSREFDRAYQGNYGEMYAALYWVLAVNYGGAFKRIPFLLGSALTKNSP